MSETEHQYQKKVILSVHGDTNWMEHRLHVATNHNENGVEECEYYGHLDNFAGVHAAMLAYFSGRLPKSHFRLEITYGEETDMEGAKQIASTVRAADIVIVIDVTGTNTSKDITIEKCYNRSLRKFITKVLQAHEPAIEFDIYAGCPDPIASQDETDVYRKKTDFSFFLGIPVRGGDYNDGPVYCWKRSIDATVEAIIAISNALIEKFDTISLLPRGASTGPEAVPDSSEFDLFGD